MSRIFRSLSILAAAAVVFTGVDAVAKSYELRGMVRSELRAGLQQMIDSNMPGNRLAVATVHVPISMAVVHRDWLIDVGLIDPQWSSYFTIDGKAGNLDPRCRAAGLPFKVRWIGGDRPFGTEITVEAVETIHACQ